MKIAIVSEKLLSLQRNNDMHMKQIEYVTIKNASNKVLKKMRQIGEEKAQRLQKIQDRWDNGEYENLEVVQL